MILILGGTTEGRTAVEVLDDAGTPFFYSTKGDMQVIDSVHGIRLCGAMDESAMERCCVDRGIRLLVDAAHPFATELHRTIAAVSRKLRLPVIRLERKYPPRDPAFIWCNDYQDAIRRMESAGIRNLLALTGVNTIGILKEYWSRHACWFRILDRPESRDLAARQGFPAERLLFYKAGDDGRLMDRICPDAVLTKESGESGFFRAKTQAAGERDIPVFVVKRPLLPETFYVVYGECGLRKQIERLLPDFFHLHCGYTTGACATAAAKAALSALIEGIDPAACEILLPSGEPVTLPIAETRREAGAVCCSVRKDAGDDPDVTNGCLISARIVVSHSAEPCVPNVLLKGGKGVGRVTLPGLGLEVGGPAINATPRKMIISELQEVARLHGTAFGTIEVTLSVENGEEIATRTFNPKLGIVGGISIIGTSGIVRPFSSDAFIASIRKEVQVAKAVGCAALVINSGAKSERFLSAYLASRNLVFPQQSFIHYGNFIGETLRVAHEEKFGCVILGIMLGKAVKLAEGALDTHSKKVSMNRDFISALARDAECPETSVSAVRDITLARELWDLLPPKSHPRFYSSLLMRCEETCRAVFPDGQLQLLLISETGEIFSRDDLMK